MPSCKTPTATPTSCCRAGSPRTSRARHRPRAPLDEPRRRHRERVRRARVARGRGAMSRDRSRRRRALPRGRHRPRRGRQQRAHHRRAGRPGRGHGRREGGRLRARRGRRRPRGARRRCEWLGVADIDEALALRDAGIDAPILAWLHDPGADFAPAVARDVELGVSSLDQLERARACRGIRRSPAAVHLKLDTGLSRNGVAPRRLAGGRRAGGRLEREGRLRVRGLFSHLANTSPRGGRRAARRVRARRSSRQRRPG